MTAKREYLVKHKEDDNYSALFKSRAEAKSWISETSDPEEWQLYSRAVIAWEVEH